MAEELMRLMSKDDIDYIRIRKSLEKGADPLHGDMSSPLTLALQLNSTTLVEILLQYANIDRLLSHANMLHYACTHSSSDCTKLLLNAGFKDHANLINDVSEKSGNTPLIAALITKKYPLAMFLLENRANPNICNRNGLYPVHIAAKHGNLELLDCLKCYGADFSIQNQKGNTPLHCANDINSIEFLVFQGHVDPFIRNSQNETASMLVRTRGNQILVDYFKDVERRWRIHNSRHAQWLMLCIRDTFKQLGIKMTLIVLIACALLAWIITVYIHKRHPFQ
jgi:ankyrin repeat protein